MRKVDFYPNPLRWYWQTYTSPSGKFRMVWRGPFVFVTYAGIGGDDAQ